MLSRRGFLSFLGALAAVGSTRSAGAAPGIVPAAPSGEAPAFEVRDLAVAGDRHLGRRFTLLVPTGPSAPIPTRLLVLFHGLGETGDERAGVYAWLERYGLADAYRRLLRPPILRRSKYPYWPAGRLELVNAGLEREPFRGLAIACPYTPNIYKVPSRELALEGYARWVAEVVLPRAQAELGVALCARQTSLDGCSLGGYVGLEVFLRRPELFGAWGSVQGALGGFRVPGYADKLAAIVARLGPRPLHLETSSDDPFHDVNLDLSKALRARSIPHELLVGSGPHNQPWLCEAGTLEMLLWHDRLGRARC